MRRYQVVFYCEKTKQTKIDIIINSAFTGAYVYAKSKMVDLNEHSEDEWVIVSIYDLEIEFQIDKKLS